MHTIKSKFQFVILVTIITMSSLIFVFSSRYEKMIIKYSDLSKNIVLIEEVYDITNDINEEIVNLLYTFPNVTAKEKILTKTESVTAILELLNSYIIENDSCFIYKRLKNSVENFNGYTTFVINAMNEHNIVIANEYRKHATVCNDVINSIIRELLVTELGHLQLLRISLDHEMQAVKIQLYLFAFIGVFLMILTLTRTETNLIKSMNILVDTFREIGKGNPLPKVVKINSHDEFEYLMTETVLMQKSILKLTQKNEESQHAIVSAIGSLAEMRDSETGEHIQRVAKYINILCNYLVKSERYNKILTLKLVNTLIQVCPLHDIGKVGIPDNILCKPSRLTIEEFKIMKLHVNYGQKVIIAARKSYGIKDSFYLDIAEKIIMEHHEKWDGSGYPNGLKGEEISLVGRIMALADVYDALTTHRVYKEAYSHKEAIKIIQDGKGSHFDPELVDAFLTCEKQFEQISKI